MQACNELPTQCRTYLYRTDTTFQTPNVYDLRLKIQFNQNMHIYDAMEIGLLKIPHYNNNTPMLIHFNFKFIIMQT